MTEMLVVSAGAGRVEEQDVRDEIRRFFDSRLFRAEAYGDLFTSLWRTASDCVSGGKLLRPRLLIGAYDALISTGEHGDTYRSNGVRIAAALEILHYTFLLHDDVIDGDVLRRGRPNLIGSLLAERLREGDQRILLSGGPSNERDLHWARSSAILMGDMLLSHVHQIFARESLPEALRLRLLDLLDHSITETIVGEQLDVALGDGITSPGLEAVLNMTRLKTAPYTFEMPLKAAAVLAGAAGETEELLGKVGALLGSAFQLQDDLLSTFGDAAEHGKDAFSDLREGKETAIIAYARTTDQWRDMEPSFGKADLLPPEANALRARLTACGAEALVRSLICDQLRRARKLLRADEAKIAPELVTFLNTMMSKLEERRS